MFKKRLIDLGNIKAKSINKVEFINMNPTNNIVQVKPSCGCTSAKLDNGNIKVTYMPDKVPFHLKEQGYYESSKYITVVYNTGESELLTIKAIVHE